MNGRAANRHEEDGLYRVFLMLAAMVVLIVRLGLDAQRAPALQSTGSGGPQATADVRTAVNWLLCLTDIAARRLVSLMRADYELMNAVPVHPGREPSPDTAGRGRLDHSYFDTS